MKGLEGWGFYEFSIQQFFGLAPTWAYETAVRLKIMMHESNLLVFSPRDLVWESLVYDASALWNQPTKMAGRDVFFVKHVFFSIQYTLEVGATIFLKWWVRFGRWFSPLLKNNGEKTRVSPTRLKNGWKLDFQGICWYTNQPTSGCDCLPRMRFFWLILRVRFSEPATQKTVGKVDANKKTQQQSVTQIRRDHL